MLSLLVVAHCVDSNVVNGEDDNIRICCVHENCSYSSLDQCLANFTSNVLINITTDVTLSSLVRASNLSNVSIIGHNYPTVNCKSTGGIHFAFCHNCTIQGISWDGCGSSVEPGLKFSYSSNVIIKNCCFQHLLGQAVVLLGVLGDVNICDCNFINNSDYTGHGAAIWFSSNDARNYFQYVFTISNCSFSYNTIYSLIYFENARLNFVKAILINSTFYRNQGISLYAINSHIYLIGKSLFQFTKNSNAKYIPNSAYGSVGAVYIYKSSIFFQENSNTVFSNNTAHSGGGIFMESHSNIVFQENSNTVFSNNTADDGGSICIVSNSNIFFQGNSSTLFSNNTASNGGSIFVELHSNIVFQENSNTVFSNNTADDGGSICIIVSNSNIFFQGNSNTLFSNNTASNGGGIYIELNSNIFFQENSNTVFSNNTANYGGGMYIALYNNIFFQGNSNTMFSNNTADYDGGGIYIKLYNNIFFRENSHTVFSNNTAAYSGGGVFIESYSNISFQENSNTVFSNNTANDGGGISSKLYSNISFQGNSTTVFSNSFTYYTVTIDAKSSCSITFDDNTTVTFNVLFGKTVFSDSSSKLIAKGNFSVTFNDHSAKWCNNTCLPYTGYLDSTVIDSDGIVWCNNQRGIYCLSDKCNCKNLEDIIRAADMYVNISDKVVLLSSLVLLYKTDISIMGHNNPTVLCTNGGRLEVQPDSLLQINVAIKGVTWIGCGFAYHSQSIAVLSILSASYINISLIIQNCSFQYSLGQVIYLSDTQELSVNIADSKFENSGTIQNYNNDIADVIELNAYYTSVLTIKNCHFCFNKALNIILMKANSPQNPDLNDAVVYLINSVFCNNKGVTVKLTSSSNLYIYGEVLFENNKADYGAGISLIGTSTVIFGENSNVTFVNNCADYNGAAMYLEDHSYAIFDSNSIVTFANNKATNGIIYSKGSSNVTFKGTCQVTFTGNLATQYGSAIYSTDNSHLIFTRNATVMFSNNSVMPFDDVYIRQGGTIFSEYSSLILFEENSNITFNDNQANFGAAIYSIDNSSVIFKDRSTVLFNNHTVHYCGVLTSVSFSNVTFADHTYATFNTNIASHTIRDSYESSAGAICAFQFCNVTFSDNSFVTFINNRADRGGAALIDESKVIIEDHSTVTFYSNFAWYSSGGAFVCSNNSNIVIKDNSNVTFNSNKANGSGGAIHSNNLCKITFKDNSTTTFISNSARDNGGALFSSQMYEITFEGNSLITFINNTSDNGGALYFINFTITFKESSKVSFYNNLASVGGGAIKAVSDSVITVTDCTTIKFTGNNAQYGGAIFLDTNAVMINNSDNTSVYFINNTAKLLGNAVYQEVTWLCNSSCIINRASGISSEFIATPPNELKFDHPVICIDKDDDIQCKQYYMQNVMLGKEIAIPACVFDFYNHSVYSTQFLVQSEKHLIYNNNGPNQVLICCDHYERVNITGNQSLSKSMNFTINFALNVALNPNWKHISVNLIVELSPCHPGFWQPINSIKCECYNDNDIVFCSDYSSMIKRGYWFGTVTGKPTVAFCPINYCNFTCCETSNGYYQLSPVRDNQCKSHRSGIACGSCEEGYTLSFDSIECLDLNECTTGQTILVLALVLLYWIIIIVAVFSLMYFKVEIGYLYAITYYYSVVDLLLNQNWYLSNVLNTTITIISSTAKIIPQFLGKFYFITNMNGIDQQFIHYIHPVALSLFLVMITILARRSRRLASFISKGIIHVICYLLLLSYTSVATTSLLLMRPLIFHDIDKVYTYISPNIEYLHGRHLAYLIVAMLFTIVIVIGLPLLLGLEPFLNSKINFVKIKPLLDQFQGCYKDKYRCFAAYYMICRLVIITIIIANSSNDFVLQYLLLAVCVITALIHLILKPYSNPLLNDFDGAILQLLILISALPFVEFIDNSDTTLLMGITFVIVMLPLLIFITMSLMINKEKIRKFPSYCYTKCSQIHLRKYNQIPLKVEELSDEEEYVSIIDDSRRINATICDV